jgi:hypothetical protein
LNQPSLNFNFNEIDKTKMAYTNILNIWLDTTIRSNIWTIVCSKF